MNNVKHYRELAAMTQEALAVKARVSRTTISNLENNIKTTITNETMNKIANALNKTVFEIFYEEKPSS
ncbi:MAG: helix-turn-helix transcriptional regulator [Bacilli bacterium]|nr:helix-turn-helix transcriptional regulator [Bacilli bacterium]MDD4794951.1 helix-turn-helix transcriptional regulator [Bacilli bacterium]